VEAVGNHQRVCGSGGKRERNRVLLLLRSNSTASTNSLVIPNRFHTASAPFPQICCKLQQFPQPLPQTRRVLKVFFVFRGICGTKAEFSRKNVEYLDMFLVCCHVFALKTNKPD
jgi:hypothetical protein